MLTIYDILLTPINKKISTSEQFAHMFAMSIGVIRTWDDINVGLMVACDILNTFQPKSITVLTMFSKKKI
jgi:hypothetical protein